MKQRNIVAGIMLSLAVIVTNSASAAMYDFEDKIDTWYADGTPGGPDDSVWMGQFLGINSPLKYSHDLNDDVDFSAGDFVIDATLELDFTDADLLEAGDEHGWFIISYDFRENATVYLDYNPVAGSYEAVEDLGEIGSGQYDLLLNVDWLNDDGILDVQIQISNPLGTGNAALDHSRLYGTAQVVPVPGAVLLGVLGLGTAGMRLRRRS